MAFYKPLIAIRVEHDYFVSGVANGLEFRPTAQTEKALQQCQLIIKSISGGILVLMDVENEHLASEDTVLRFEVFATDVHFSTYTQALSQDKEQPAYYSTANVIGKNSAGMNILGVLPQLVEESVDHVKPVRPLKMSLAKPNFVVDCFIGSDDFDRVKQSQIDDASAVYCIPLSARWFYWKYYFFGDLASQKLAIHDLNSQAPMLFDECDEPIAKNGKAYISQKEIVLTEVPSQRFQLRELKAVNDLNSSGKVLVKRLPNASVQMLGKGRNSSGQAVLVAEIYVNQ
jgi:hypothetical protein